MELNMLQILIGRSWLDLNAEWDWVPRSSVIVERLLVQRARIDGVFGSVDSTGPNYFDISQKSQISHLDLTRVVLCFR